MLAFLLAKPTQFDSPFFKWMYANRPGLPIVVFYWRPVAASAESDSETGAPLAWGFNVLEGYPWQQADPSDAESFQKLLQQYGVSYLVCNGWKEGFGPLIRAAKGMGVRLGLRIDSVSWNKGTLEMKLRSIFLASAYRSFSHFFSSGSVCDQYLAELGYPIEKIRRWPYCIDAGFFTRTDACRQEAADLKIKYDLDERPVVLAVCKWIDRENPLELLKAFAYLNQKDLQLVMIGDGMLHPQMNALRAQYPDLAVTFPGYTPYVQLPAWYALASVFVHPANFEVWGVSIHEAIASGCAVITSTRVGSGYDLIREGENGFQYPLGNIPALAKCIKDALALPPEAVAKANEPVLKDWNYQAIVRNFEGL